MSRIKRNVVIASNGCTTSHPRLIRGVFDVMGQDARKMNSDEAQRIAIALERIASALDTSNAKDEDVIELARLLFSQLCASSSALNQPGEPDPRSSGGEIPSGCTGCVNVDRLGNEFPCCSCTINQHVVNRYEAPRKPPSSDLSPSTSAGEDHSGSPCELCRQAPTYRITAICEQCEIAWHKGERYVLPKKPGAN